MLNNIWERVVFIERAFTQSFAVHIHVSLAVSETRALFFLRCAIVSLHRVRQCVSDLSQKPRPSLLLLLTILGTCFEAILPVSYFLIGLG